MTARRPAQTARLATTVVAGAASLCLTFAAGAYIVNHMPEPTAPSGSGASAPGAEPVPGFRRPALADPGTPRLTTDIVTVAFATEQPRTAQAAATQQSGVGATPDDSTLAGRVRIGTTYVGAQVAPARTDTIAVTVDTNLVTMASKYLGITVDPAGVTALRTELDTRRGELVFVLSDPGLGSHTLRVERVQKPGTTAPDETAPADTELPGEQVAEPAEEAPTTVGV